MRVNNWLSGFACVLLLGVVGCKKDKIRAVSYTHLTLPTIA